MCTDNNLITTCSKYLIALIASFSVIGFGFITQAGNNGRVNPSLSTAEASSSSEEGFIISKEGFIAGNSPNYHYSQVTAVDDHHSKKEDTANRTIVAELTGYSSTIDQTNSEPFITASGARVRDGIVAANFLPFGTEIKIPNYYGDKVFVVKDRMNTRYSEPKDDSYDGYIDIWFSSRKEATNFGRVREEVVILN